MSLTYPILVYPELYLLVYLCWYLVIFCYFVVFIVIVLEFIKGGRKDDFPKLQVRYKKGSSPVLKLLDDGNTVADSLA